MGTMCIKQIKHNTIPILLFILHNTTNLQITDLSIEIQLTTQESNFTFFTKYKLNQNMVS